MILLLCSDSWAQTLPDDLMNTPPKATSVGDSVHRAAMDMSYGKPAIDVLINGRGPYRLLVDSGASPALVLDDSLAAELELAQIGTSNVGDISNPQAIKVAVHPVSSLSIGGAAFSDFVAISWDRGNKYTGDNPPRGVIGFPMFRDVLVTFDYPKQELRIVSGSLGEGDHVVAFTSPDGVPVVPFEIGGKSYDSYLDSGSMAPIILPLELQDELKLESPMTEVASGRTVNSTFTILSARYAGSLSVAGHTIPAETLMFSDIFPKPVVGSQTLSNFVITYDQRASTVRFLRPADGATAASSAPRGSLGIVLARVGAEYTVSSTVPDTPAGRSELQKGDRLISVNGIEPQAGGLEQLRSDSVTVIIERDGARKEIKVR